MSRQNQYEEARLALESGVAAVESIIRDRDEAQRVAQVRLERLTELLDRSAAAGILPDFGSASCGS